MASAHHLAAQAPRYSLPSMPGAANDCRLPSLKDLNFQYRSPAQGQEGPPLSIPSGSPPAEHIGSTQSRPARHDPATWSRPSPTPVFAPMPPQHQHPQHPHPHPHQPAPPPAPPPHQHQQQYQHSPPLSAGHEQQPSRPVDYGVQQRHDSGGYLTPGLPLSAQVTPLPGTVTIGPGSRGDESHSQQHPSKRSRTNLNMGVPRDNRPAHASYPIQQSPQYSPQQQAAFHTIQPAPGPAPSHEQVPQQPTHGGYPHAQYGYVSPPQYISSRPHNMQPQAHQQQQAPGHSYLPPPPPQQDSWDHQQAPAATHQHPPNHQQQCPPQLQQYQPQQQQHINFARTTTLVPQNVDSRMPPYQANHAEREQKMSEIIERCKVLYKFANHYVQLQASHPHVQPSPQELNEMHQRAKEVVHLLEEYKRLTYPEFEGGLTESGSTSRCSEDHRPPKRPWEEMAQEDGVINDAAFADQYSAATKAQTTAEQDMEIIRTKRATSVAGGAAAAGQPKSKYRKRSSGQRATPPGKCHSCNIRETPEWRRGPDGARTLCNACGLHYAKLMRKRDKQIAAEGQAPRIDMETLRASARAADLDKSHSRVQTHTSSSQVHQVQPSSDSTSLGPGDQPHHQGSFHVNIGPSGSSSVHTTLSHPSQGMVPAHDTGIMAPLVPWNESGLTKGHGYGPVSSQSFMRTSQHVGSNDSPSRR